MNNIEIPPFYVGQEVISKITGVYLRLGMEYVITKCWLGCHGWYCSVGIISINGCECEKCGKHLASPGGDAVFYTHLFRPKIEISAFISMSEVVKLETVGAN